MKGLTVVEVEYDEETFAELTSRAAQLHLSLNEYFDMVLDIVLHQYPDEFNKYLKKEFFVK